MVTPGLSPHEAVAVAKRKFQKSVEITCQHPGCHLQVTCFKFILTKGQNKQYSIECGNHGVVQGNKYWRHRPSAFKCAVWQSWIGNNIQGTCHVCNDQIYCTLHVLDMST